MSQQGVQKNELLQKKHMFHMAFDDMVNQQLLPGFADNSEEV